MKRLWSDEALRWRLANPEARYGVERRHGTMTVTSATGLKGVGSILYDGPWDAPGGDSAAAGPLDEEPMTPAVQPSDCGKGVG